jgi:hypothetical protein
MRKQLEYVMPVGAPWGGPESSRFMSCFTSMVYAIEGFGGSEPLYCCQGPGPCTRCGKCGAFDWREKYHEQIYHLYLTLSGLACLTLWDGATGDPRRHWIHQPWPVPGGDAYITRAMDFAGYRYIDTEENVWDAVKASIDDNRPALAYGLAGDDWTLVTGYDPAGVIDSAGDSHPVAPGVRVVAVTGKKEGRADYAEEFRYLAGVLRAPNLAAPGCVAGFAAHDAVAELLSDDAPFAHADEACLSRVYQGLHAFIGMLAENRAFAAMTLLEGFYGLEAIGEAAKSVSVVVGSYFMETHNRCWDAWAVMGANHICEPDKYAGRLRDRVVRDALGRHMETFRRHDEMAVLLLEEAANTPFLRPRI